MHVVLLHGNGACREINVFNFKKKPPVLDTPQLEDKKYTGTSDTSKHKTVT